MTQWREETIEITSDFMPNRVKHNTRSYQLAKTPKDVARVWSSVPVLGYHFNAQSQDIPTKIHGNRIV
jgi:hypothetical protein